MNSKSKCKNPDPDIAKWQKEIETFKEKIRFLKEKIKSKKKPKPPQELSLTLVFD